MTIKQKAERYDELLKKLQEAKEDNNVCDERFCCVIDDIVPELKESEDEKIRKGLIEYFKDFRLGTFAYLEPKKIIAWLEKQGEHSVSPLFTFEDVLTIQCAMAYAKFQDRELDVALKKLHDKVYDAYHDSKNHHIESQDGLKAEQIPANSAKTCKDEQKPYGKREECYDCQMNYGGTCKGSCAMKRGEQKPSEWGDKDDLRYCIDYVRPQHPTHDNGSVNIRHYRIPSFVGDKGAESILSVILSFGAKIVALYRGNVREGKLDEWNTPFIVDKEDWYTEDWLKSLKDRVQPQQWWSEEDEEIRNNCIYWLEKARKYFEKDEDLIYDKKWIVKCTDWLKSLKGRVGCEVNCTTTWKPSDEQMDALDSTLQYSQVSHNSFEYLNSLFNDLKKLREE